MKVKKRIKVLVLSDSLAAPRTEPELLPYESTWPVLLAESVPDALIYQVSIGSAIASDLLYQTRYWKAFFPDLVIVQAGLCDCLPRAFKLWEIGLLGKLFGESRVQRLTARYAVSIRKRRGIHYTPIESFKKTITDFKNIFPNLVWIKIVPGMESEERRLPGHIENIRQFNMAIEEMLPDRHLNTGDISADDLISDHFHLNVRGHQKIMERVRPIVEHALHGNRPVNHLEVQ